MSRLGQLWESYGEGMQYVVGEGVTVDPKNRGIRYVEMFNVDTGALGFLMEAILDACEGLAQHDDEDPPWKRVA